MCKWLWEVLKEFVLIICNWACSLTYPALGSHLIIATINMNLAPRVGRSLGMSYAPRSGEELGSEPCFQTREELGNEPCSQAGLGTSIVP